MAKLIPPVKQRTRVSARVTEPFADALQRQQLRYEAAQTFGGASLPELVTLAVVTYTDYDLDAAYRQFRTAKPAMLGQRTHHLQPRIPDDAVTYVDYLKATFRGKMFDRDATRETVLIATLSNLLRQPGNVGDPHHTTPQGN